MRCASCGSMNPATALRMRAVRRAATRGSAAGPRIAAHTSSTRPRRTGRRPGNVPEVPQVLSHGKQILRILWNPSTGELRPEGDSARAGAGRGAPKARRATTSATRPMSPPTARGPARACPSPRPMPPPHSAAACGSTAATCRPARASASPAPRASTPSAGSASGQASAPAAMNIPDSAMEGTVVFSGLRAAPRIEVRISEKKPDGTFGRAVPVVKETFIGRENCDLNYPQDMLLSPRHASVAVREGKLVLKDLNSQNGSFIRQKQDTELIPGDVFLLGRELFRFVTQSLDDSLSKESAEGTMVWSAPKLQKGPLTAKLEHIKLNGEVVAEFKLDKPETTLGRTTGDLVFKDDPYMSGTHARIVAQPGRFLLQDLRSRNGVYRRVRAEIELTDGDEFFMGEQLFHVDLKSLR